jgi:hypothetical protein
MEFYGKVKTAFVGECIYCRRKEPEVALSNEHVIPFALGADVYLEKASCPDCAMITSSAELHVARNFFGHLRVHSNVQTRRPNKRPTELSVWVERSGIEYEKKLPIQDHPFFVRLPIWRAPAVLFGREYHGEFRDLFWSQYHWLPPHIAQTLGLLPGEVAKLTTKDRLDVPAFARVIAKIAYCSAVARYGLAGIDWGALPNVILGTNRDVSDYVGVRHWKPLPPEPHGQLTPMHAINVLEMTGDGRHYAFTDVRLFCASTVSSTNIGMPTYTVALGMPLADLSGSQRLAAHAY